MRKAINENPVVQLGLLGVLGVLVAVVFMSGMGGGSAEPEPATDTAATPATSSAPEATAPSTSSTVAPSTAAPEAAVSAAPAGTTPFEASKGLPENLVDAYNTGDVVVLLVMQADGYEDKPIHRDVQSLESRGDTSVFVTDVKHVSKYSRIAEGVTLDRVPAIIVLHPFKGKLAKGEAVPMPPASVAYGYRGEESVTQAVNDALYKGDSKSYAP
ncbi:MAG: hypothetical protein QOI31_2635 [Solirubrobacterales bacterium]|jgi:hypothetical protein|nr:hypothetical protein [Solirubrobacterales bacterium]